LADEGIGIVKVHGYEAVAATLFDTVETFKKH
jgi:hypothetical protein